MCKNGEWFKKVENVKIPDTSQKTFGRTKLSMEECKKECLNNCTCAAYTSLESGECVTWHGDLMDMRIFNGGLDLYIRMDAAEEPSTLLILIKQCFFFPITSKTLIFFFLSPIVRKRAK